MDTCSKVFKRGDVVAYLLLGRSYRGESRDTGLKTWVAAEEWEWL